MIRVGIIDDENIIRIGLKAIIDWEKNGFLIVGEANNGRDGLEMIRRTSPNLVITDIKMPQMDGIELMSEVGKFDSSVKFIVMSGYGDYPLVRSAMQLGAIDYMMKLELGPKGLLESLNLYREKYYKRASDSDAVLVQKDRTVREKEFVNFLLYEQPSREPFAAYLKTLGIELNETLYTVALLTSPEAEDDTRRQNLRNTCLKDVPDEILSESLQVSLFEKDYGVYLLLISAGPGMDADQMTAQITESYRRIEKRLKAYLNSRISLAVGVYCDSFDQISRVVESCKRVRRNLLYHGQNGLLFSADLEHSQRSPDLIGIRKKLHQALYASEKEPIIRVFEEIRQEITAEDVSREDACEVLQQIIYYLTVSSQEGGSFLHHLTQHSDLLSEIRNLSTAAQAGDCIDTLRDRIISSLFDDPASTNRKNIYRAKQYIAERIHERITLNDVAAYIHISPNYLSAIFKKETGKGFNEYFNEQKIQKAKELISSGNFKVYEISGMLGFENSYYFSKVFKKITGMSPTEYEERFLANG